MQEATSLVNKKILLFIPARLGDALFCTPAIHLLKKNCPEIEFDVLALSKLSFEVIEHNPDVSKAYLVTQEKETQKLAKEYDLLIGLHANAEIQSHLAAVQQPNFCVPVPHANQHQSLQTTNFARHLLQHALEKPETNIQLNELNYFLYPQTKHFAKINEILTRENPASQILIGCHLGCHSLAKASWKWWKLPEHKKVWGLDNFIELGKLFSKQHPHIRFVLTGAEAEQRLAKRFTKAVPATINLIGKTSVLELAALMKNLKLFISCDTGALHVACAMQTNLIALFGPTILGQTGPFPMQKNYTILKEDRMCDITVKSVYSALIDQLQLHL